jgi:hypothetical protein
LRSANEHLDHVIVQAVIKLALEGPLELRVIEVPRVKIEIIRMNFDAGIFEGDDDLDAVTLFACVEVQQWMLVKVQLIEDALQAVGGHESILKLNNGGPKFLAAKPPEAWRQNHAACTCVSGNERSTEATRT